MADALLDGKTLTPEVIQAAAQAAMEEANPIDDVRASGSYRKQQVFVLVRRLVSQAWQQSSEGDKKP
jgi:carbon-monoxide dehydrogenase medium subunit